MRNASRHPLGQDVEGSLSNAAAPSTYTLTRKNTAEETLYLPLAIPASASPSTTHTLTPQQAMGRGSSYLCESGMGNTPKSTVITTLTRQPQI